jgi:hypothetical protein
VKRIRACASNTARPLAELRIILLLGVPYRIRTGVAAVRGQMRPFLAVSYCRKNASILLK